MLPVIRKRYTAYVVFQGAEHRRAWRIFTRRGWRHCWLIMPANPPKHSLFAKAFAILIGSQTDHVSVDFVQRPSAELAQEALKDGATCVIKIAIDQKFTGAYVPRGLLTCVSLVKAALGLKAWYVWTPKHLARYLLRSGGRLIEREPDDLAVFTEEGQARRERAAGAAPSGAGREPTVSGGKP